MVMMVMTMKGCKECLLAQSVSVWCMHTTMVCNYVIINHLESTECNLLIFYCQKAYKFQKWKVQDQVFPEFGMVVPVKKQKLFQRNEWKPPSRGQQPIFQVLCICILVIFNHL